MEILTVCPHHTDVYGQRADPALPYPELLAAHCAMAERLGAEAMLVFDFWQSLDPWVTAQLILSATTVLEPVVAVNPALTHPAVAARFVASLAHVYGRRVNLNVVAGAKQGELAALGVPTVPDEDKYARTADFITALGAVLAGRPYEGPYYRLDAPSLEPPADPARAPRILAPGSRAPGVARILPLLDRALVMAKPRKAMAEEHERLVAAGLALTQGMAMIVGVVARPTTAQAWAAAREHYAGSRRDKLAARMFSKQITSSQHRANLDAAAEAEVYDECLWYGADRIGMDCPKLVGSYDEVAHALAAYEDLGVRTVILDLPFAVAEYEHIGLALEARSGGPAGH